MIDEKYIKENPCVAYLAHPYGGSHCNKVEARQLAGSLYEKYPMLTILNPLDNGEYMLGEDEENIINHDLELLTRCDVLILAPGWESSKGCNKELNSALDKGMDILKVEYNGEDLTLSVFRQAASTFESETVMENWQKAVEEAARALKTDDKVKFAFVHVVGDSAGKLSVNGFVTGSGLSGEIIQDAQTAAATVADDVVRTLARNEDKKAEVELRTNLSLSNDRDICKLVSAILGSASGQILAVALGKGETHDIH